MGNSEALKTVFAHIIILNKDILNEKGVLYNFTSGNTKGISSYLFNFLYIYLLGNYLIRDKSVLGGEFFLKNA